MNPSGSKGCTIEEYSSWTDSMYRRYSIGNMMYSCTRTVHRVTKCYPRVTNSSRIKKVTKCYPGNKMLPLLMVKTNAVHVLCGGNKMLPWGNILLPEIDFSMYR